MLCQQITVLRLRALLVAGCCAALLAGCGSSASAASKAQYHGPHYYLALGDSLSVGFQPTATGKGVETGQGYVNDIYAAARKRIADLKLVQLGCPGETTSSMLTGTGNGASVKQFHCDRTGGSQLKAATAFLEAHHSPGEVSLITIDIGANDVNECGSELGSSIIAADDCVNSAVATVASNLPKILGALRTAAARRTPLAAMNLYDPFLAEELSSNAEDRFVATLSLSIIKSLNAQIGHADTASGFVTANVAGAFATYDQAQRSTTATSLAGSGRRTVPTDLADICALTWICAPAPRGPNIHANRAGYSRIARAFEAVLPTSLS